MFTIPCMYYRGGTSKGPCFIKEDLPSNILERDKVLLKLMGSPDKRQINGIGGGDSLSSKVVIVAKSKRENIDIDYHLSQVNVENPFVDNSLNCGNMLSAVAPFAIERGIVETTHPETILRIYNENTGVVMEVVVQTPNNKITYVGDAEIDGVLGTGSPIYLTFLNPAGSKTKCMLPTGNVIDNIHGLNVSCVDYSVPMVIVSAHDFDKTGYESKSELDSDRVFMNKLEEIRKLAALKMGLGDVSGLIQPKVCLISSPRNQGTITSRYFTPFDCHNAHAVSGALCLSAALLIPGTIAHRIAKVDNIIMRQTLHSANVVIEHLSGKIETVLQYTKNKHGEIEFPKASIIRTARPLFDGYVFVPGEKTW